MKKNKGIMNKILCAMILVFSITVLAPINGMAMADDVVTNNAEDELTTIIESYEDSNLQVKNGLSIDVGQTIDYTSLIQEEEASIDFQLVTKDENIVAVNEDGQFVGVAEGETYISLESAEGNYLYAIEVTTPIISSYSVASNDENNRAAHSIYKVVIDAGHGGKDPGATGNGLREKDLTLAIALKVQRLLSAQGVQVVMSRTTDKFLELKEISSIANNSASDAFVSIHINATSGSSTTANGIETYYYRNRTDSKPLADLAQAQLVKSTGAYNRGVKTGDFHVVRETKMPSALVECGFINNQSEAIKMNTNSYQELLANGIANGVTKYLEANVVLDTTPATRINGATRFETSYEVARKGWNSANTVIIANGDDYPDALCAGPLAAKYDAPILLANNISLGRQSELKALLKSLSVKNAIIVGGTGVISASLENEIKSMGIGTERLGGIDRYETSVKIAEKVGNNGEFVVATGTDFADSLSMSAVAAKKRMPILLTRSRGLSDYVKSYLAGQNVTKTFVVGGDGVVPNHIMNELTNPERLGGIDRYVTNEVIFNRFKDEINKSEMYMALGTNFPDALSVSALAAKNSSFVLLSRQDMITQSIRNIVDGHRAIIDRFYILGGPTLISDNILRSVKIRVQ